jgi:hypothetical protein
MGYGVFRKGTHLSAHRRVDHHIATTGGLPEAPIGIGVVLTLEGNCLPSLR